MIICGLNLSHDGSVALLDGSQLLFSIEVEKLDNQERHAPVERLETIEEILRLEGCDPADVDLFAVDGWHADPGAPTGSNSIGWHGHPLELSVAPYQESGVVDAGRRYDLGGLPIGGKDGGYVSFHHATDHVFAAYCTSPFAVRREPALVLVWDGGMLPLLYQVDPGRGSVTSYGPLFPLFGNAFAEFAGHLEPFRANFESEIARFGRARPSDVAGKAMAYAGLGMTDPGAFAVFDDLLDERGLISIDAAGLLAQDLLARRERLLPDLTDADLVASFQEYLGVTMERAFRRVVPMTSGAKEPNLCLSGGCALNIKWNSRLRSSGLFEEIWVPPFPNDAGSAIGAACSALADVGRQNGSSDAPALDWDVYRGPGLRASTEPTGWRRFPCPPDLLAEVLAESGEPVVVVDGRAELGPRALGNRSILAAPTYQAMKDRLNEMKGRESYRPVAPICLERHAPEVFDPGTPDPFMLFDHRVRSDWRDRLPAIVHADGTARLQTVSAAQNPVVAAVLEAFHQRTGIPVLCNTSANRRGRGFFPDVASAAGWGGTGLVWSGSWLLVAPDQPVPGPVAGEARRC